MPKLILVRHGQTAYNLERRYQGAVDIPLNASGLQQALQLKLRLANFHLDAAYTSDLRRARETARIILDQHPSGLTAKPLDLIREISGGEFEGLHYEQMQAQYPEELKAWEADRYNVRAPQGENLKDVLIRLVEFLEIVQKEQPSEDLNVLIVTHGGVISTLLCHFMNMDPNKLWQWRLDNCSLTIVDPYPQGAILSLFNDTSHLGSGMPSSYL
jgi:alpha-ribazole phosphatase/probable phosphoglycerate mutase